MDKYNFKDGSFPQFVEFLFNRPTQLPEAHMEFEDLLVVDFDPVLLAEYYIQLFSEPLFLLERFSREQLEQGFWQIQNINFTGSVYAIMWGESVPLSLRLRCIDSMYFLYKNLFAVDGLFTSSNMWWDCLLDGHSIGDKHSNHTEDEGKVQNLIFEVLCKILQLDSEECQGAALHGLNHLRHPATESTILDYIKSHPELKEDEVDYCMDCINGEIM